MGRKSTVRRRQLARQLRRLRETAGFTLEEAAPKLDWSASKLSRIETAQQRVDVHAVRSMLDLYDIGGDRWTELVALTREAWHRGWWRAYGVGDNSYVALEADATLVRDFTWGYVPGLLQTTDYARAIFQRSLQRRTAEQLESDVELRMRRQQRLTDADDPLELVAVVEESVLRRPVGGVEVLRAQLSHVVEAAALPSVTLQVLPTEVGAHASMAGVFTVLSFDGFGEPDIAYVEHPLGAVDFSKEIDVERARLVFDHLRAEALGPAESVAMIERVVAQM